MLVYERRLNHTFGNVEMLRGGGSIALPRMVGADIRNKIVEWTKQALGEGVGLEIIPLGTPCNGTLACVFDTYDKG